MNKFNFSGSYYDIGYQKGLVHKKIAKDVPIEKILLETDSPWFGGKTEKGDRIRGTPLNIKIPAGKIAEIKKIEFNEVWRICGENAIKFFNLSL